MAELIFPAQFTTRMKEQLGSEYPDFEAAHLSPAPVSIRLNPLRKVQHESAPIPWTKTGRYLHSRPSFTLDPIFHGGGYYVQEASSMLLEQAILQLPSIDYARVLDLCAAPGGKSTHLVALLPDSSLLFSNEVIRSRTTILAENLIKWGAPNKVITALDPAAFGSVPNFFDLMVTDVPCSGEGLFRKDPGAMTEWSSENASICVKRQRRILEDIWPALKPGGYLIYSTCTYNPAENEGNLQWFCEATGAESISLNLNPDWGIRKVDSNQIHGYQCMPHQVQGEGFFLAVLRKPGADSTFERTSRPTLTGITASEFAGIKSLCPSTETHDFFNLDTIRYLSRPHQQAVEVFKKHLPVVSAGCKIGEFKHQKFIPDHELALASVLDQNSVSAIDTELTEALGFLRCETPPLEAPTRGFQLIRYQCVALGWINHLGNRYNNLYPANWRIRMTANKEGS